MKKHDIELVLYSVYLHTQFFLDNMQLSGYAIKGNANIQPLCWKTVLSGKVLVKKCVFFLSNNKKSNMLNVINKACLCLISESVEPCDT